MSCVTVHSLKSGTRTSSGTSAVPRAAHCSAALPEEGGCEELVQQSYTQQLPVVTNELVTSPLSYREETDRMKTLWPSVQVVAGSISAGRAPSRPGGGLGLALGALWDTWQFSAFSA